MNCNLRCALISQFNPYLLICEDSSSEVLQSELTLCVHVSWVLLFKVLEKVSCLDRRATSWLDFVNSDEDKKEKTTSLTNFAGSVFFWVTGIGQIYTSSAVKHVENALLRNEPVKGRCLVHKLVCRTSAIKARSREPSGSLNPKYLSWLL